MEKKIAHLGEPTINQVVAGGRRKLHYLYPDGTEMVEEFDVTSSECLVRKIKKPRDFGEASWQYEIGQATEKFNPEADLLAPSTQNPVFLRKDTDARFEWRIRNLPYAKEVYNIEIDHTKQ